MKKAVFFLIILFMAFSCNKRDNFRPVVEYIMVDTIIADTIFNMSFPFITEYRLTDNEGVEEYRFEFIKTIDSMPDLHVLEIKNIGGPKDYLGSTTVNFSNDILDTILYDTLGFYKINLDCFDKTGNTAIQKKILVEIILD
jgi:hypothetical protein